jgi:hypothetical protein
MEEIKGLGHKEALLVLSTIANDENAEIGWRVGAASALAPFQHPKLQSIPTPRFIDLQLDVPEFTHVSEAENFLAKIAVLVARGHLDIQSAQELSALVRSWIDVQYSKEELQFKISPPDERDTVIKIEGGLPALPGTSSDMPTRINGHQVDAAALAVPNDVIPPAELEAETAGMNSTTPGELKAQGPHPLQEHHFRPEPNPGKNSTGNGSSEPPDQGP